jgi:transposase
MPFAMDGKELKRYNEITGWMQHYRSRCYQLEADLRTVGPALYHANQTVAKLKRRVGELERINQVLVKRLTEMTEKLDHEPRAIPAFVKPNILKKIRKLPGRKAGHEAAHRPMPEKIDTHIDVPVPVDGGGAASCPHCHAQLAEVQEHERVVEDITPAKVRTTCYHTISGYCPGCRKQIESRAPEQPPAADVPQAQLGINVLATAALMRVQYRLPYRLITQLMADLPGLTLSPGTVARQIERMGRWLEGEYDRLRIFLHHAPAVHMDETGWRVAGENQWLWAMLDEKHTLFHIDKSRGNKVVRKLLGDVFGGVLVTDFYSAYAGMDCRKQKCLVHLLRELRDTAARSPAFANGPFQRRLKRLTRELLLLRKQKSEIKQAEYQTRGHRLEERLKELAGMTWNEAHAARISKRLRRHEKELTLFLWEDAVDGTNNAAERALRPAVVMRKITGGSRSERGARATAVLMSVLRTARQQARPLFETIRTLLMNAWAGKNPGLLTDVLTESS